jgi:tRNA (guanine-N7-)-methyltransferase
VAERPGPGGRDRWPASFRRRQGQQTRAQRRALREHWARFGVSWSYGQVHQVEQLFGRSAPCTLEVGFGMGECILARAQTEPERNFLGVEVHVPAIGAVCAQAAELGLQNLRIVREDVLRLLNDQLAPSKFDQVCVFFPDPFPKRPERRLIRPLFTELLALHGQPGTQLFLATDVQSYAEFAEGILSHDPRFTLQAKGERPPFRPLSKYESKGHAEGRETWELRWGLV